MRISLFALWLFLLLPTTLFAAPSEVPKTGQVNSYATGDDGDLQKGASWPDLRFTVNGDGTVTDNLTGLIWLMNANCFGYKPWDYAMSYASNLSSGRCGLTDGSADGDWRLPNLVEIESLVDTERYEPALPDGHPFSSVQLGKYWSSSVPAHNTNYACYVHMLRGTVYCETSSSYGYVWPVRGGQ